jgi:hypothetical protein
MKMYTLTLTITEQKAINWIGNRYRHGNDLYNLLVLCTWEFEGQRGGDTEWAWGMHDITFKIPESIAWQIVDIIEDENERLSCFANELKNKLYEFSAQVV